MYNDGLEKYYELKIDEQCDIYSKEVNALRAALKEQFESLQRIYAIKGLLITKDGKYHHILKQFEAELDIIFDEAHKHMGLGKAKNG